MTKKRQSKKGSFAEACSSTLIAFVVSLLAWEYAVRPMIYAGWLSVDDSILITLFFTVLSLTRSYIIRRLGNAWLK